MITGNQIPGYPVFQLPDGIDHLGLTVSALPQMTKLSVFVNF